MCITCEHELWDEHRALERELFKPCKSATSSLAPAPKEPAITVSLLATRSMSAPSARPNHGAKNSWRPRAKSKARTSCCFRSRAGQRFALEVSVERGIILGGSFVTKLRGISGHGTTSLDCVCALLPIALS